MCDEMSERGEWGEKIESGRQWVWRREK